MRVRTTIVLGCVLACATAGVASAKVDPTRCSVQGRFIDVEGATNGVPDDCSDGRCADFTVVIRDFAGNPSAGATVVVDFSGCPDIQIACDQLNAATGQSYLGGKQVALHADFQGRATFRVQGAALASSVGAPGTLVNTACANVSADGVSLTPLLVVAAYDVNGFGNGVNGSDIAFVAAESAAVQLGRPAFARDDYNHSGTVNGADIARSAAMATDQALGTGSSTTGPYCP